MQRGLRLRLHDGHDDRHLQVHAARDVDERAALPAGLVAGDERVLAGDDRAEVLLDELGVLRHRRRQRHDDRAVGRGLQRIGEDVVDLLEQQGAVGRVDETQPGSRRRRWARARRTLSRSTFFSDVNSQPGLPRNDGSGRDSVSSAARSRRAASHAGSVTADAVVELAN